MRRSLTNLARGEWLIIVRALVRVREEAGLSQSELARRLGRRQSYVWKVENAQQRIDLLELVDICRACQTDAGQIVAEIVRSLPDSAKR